MGCSTREEVTEAHAAQRAAVSRLLDLNTEALTSPELLRCLQNREIQRRRECAAEHALINQLRAQASEKELGGRLHTVLADLLHSSPPPKPPLKPAAASPTPTPWDHAARSPANPCPRRCRPPRPPSATAPSAPGMSW